MLRVQSKLSKELESLIHRTIGCLIAVHRALGPGLLEGIYCRAVSLELKESQIPFEREKAVPVSYRGHLLCHHRLDLIIAGSLIVEIKAVDRLAPVHKAQLLSYLRLTGVQVGLLVNFNVAVLQDGLKRIVL